MKIRLPVITLLAVQAFLVADVVPERKLNETKILEVIRSKSLDVQYSDAQALGLASLPYLHKVLTDRSQSDYWSNAVIVLGYIGHESSVKPLRDFLEQGSGRIGMEEFRAKRNVPLALGFIVNQTGSSKALAYLEDGLKPAEWRTRVAWTGPYDEDKSKLAEYLSRRCFQALGVAGDRALTILQHQTCASARCKFGDVLADALEANRKIHDVGLANYLNSTSQ